MDKHKTLLVGALAVQEGIIVPGQLAEAYADWLGRQDTSLIDVLKERGWLGDEDTARLRALADKELAQRGGDLRRCLGTIQSRVWHSLAGLQEATFNQSIAAALLPPAANVTDELAKIRHLFDRGAEPPASPSVRYQRLHPHAAGGIGQVWLVRDVHLGREVALKELRDETADDAEVRTRFLEEARITGQLEHPGIVPVYELAQAPEGQQPFYIMRFVKGRTLSAAVADYHRQRREGKADPLARNTLLNAFIGVCNTLAYAHARGVVHRDLKGQNVILGDFGEVIVLDWGLAKRLHEKEATSAIRPGEAPAWSSSPSLTQAGQVMGTPAYMAPEQAAGEVDKIDARTDIYGLGAMLYEILTGRAPFSVSDDPALPGDATDRTPEIKSLLRRIIDEAPLRPRDVAGDVPPALEAVCLHALAKHPADRYASASDLTSEIQRWLADEPVQAYPEPLRVRAGRWARRNKALVSSGVVLLLAAVVGLSVTTVLIGQEQARTELEAQRARENFQLAQGAVDRYFVQISEERLLHEDGMQALREDLLQTAREYYENFFKKHQDDPALQADLGKALFKLAFVSSELGKPDEALTTLDRAITLFEKLATAESPDIENKIYLGKCYTRRGYVYFGQNKNRAAEDDCLKAKEILEQLNLPKNLDVQRTLGHTVLNLGRLYERKGDRVKELEAHNAAAAIYQNLVAAEPENRDYLNDLAAAYTNLAVHHGAKQQWPASLEHTRKARDIQENLVKKHPNISKFQRDLAKSLNNLGILLSDVPEGLETYQRAFEIRKKLADRNPGVPDYQSELGMIQFNIARYHERKRSEAMARKDEKAAAAAAIAVEQGFKKALDIHRTLAAEYPKVTRYGADVAVVEANLADLWFDAKPKAALPLYAVAIAPLEEAVKINPQSMYHRLPLRNSYWGLAQLGVAVPNKRHAWQRALELDDGSQKAALLSAWTDASLALLKKGDHAAAAAEADLMGTIADLPLGALVRRAGTYASCCEYVFSAGDKKLADAYARKCVTALIRAEEAGFLKNPSARKTLELYGSLPPLAANPDFQALLKRAP